MLSDNKDHVFPDDISRADIEYERELLQGMMLTEVRHNGKANRRGREEHMAI